MSDRRVNYTKMMLKQSLLQLLLTKPINKITIKELCETADINRATFYTHYQDAYDLLRQIENELFAEIHHSIDTELRTEQMSEFLESICSCIRKNKELCEVIFGEFGDKDFLRRILNIAHDWSIQEWQRTSPRLDDKSLERVYAFIAHGSAQVIRDWVQSGMLETPKQIALFIESLCYHGLSILTK